MSSFDSRLRPLRFVRRRVTEGERQQLIAQSAYLRSEQRQFQPGHEVEDWLAAEAEVDQAVDLDRHATF